MPYPAAGLALIETLGEVAEVQLRHRRRCADEAAAARARLDALIADSDEHQELVRQLEEQVDAHEAAPTTTAACPRARSWPPSSSATSATRTS